MANGHHASKPPAPQDSIRCAKCRYLNPATEQFCRACEASLYIACMACDHMNPLSRSRCVACGRRLHRKFWRLRYLLKRVPWLRWILSVNPLYVLLLVGLTLLFYVLVVWMANL